MSSQHSELPALLSDILHTFKPLFVKGTSEYEVIKRLQQAPYCLFNQHALQDPLLLFQTHFVFYHCLYHLRNQWRQQKVGELEIGLTQIILHSFVHSNEDLKPSEPLAEYYLDWSNFSATNAEDVETLLDSFWHKMDMAGGGIALSKSALKEACSVMQISSTALSLAHLKQQYRRLQHKHHPDKGGDIQTSQFIVEAYTRLRSHILACACK